MRVMRKQPYVYLCSRVSPNARPLNDRVARSLRRAGFKVFVPHAEEVNNLPLGVQLDPQQVFDLDFTGMRQADLCVVVGRTGKDCAWEIGWFAGRGVPTYFVTFGDTTWFESPMTIPSLSENLVLETPAKCGIKILKHYLLRNTSRDR